MPQKLNNRRVYPDANHQPNHKAKFRFDEAKERQEAYNNLTIQQKIELLDTRLGKGVGAVKQRARLAAQLEEQNKPKPTRQERKEAIDTAVAQAKKDGLYEVLEHRTSEIDVWKDDSKKDNTNKKYMKGARQ